MTRITAHTPVVQACGVVEAKIVAASNVPIYFIETVAFGTGYYDFSACKYKLDFWTHASVTKNLVLGNVSCYMWQLGGCVLKSPAVDSVNCFIALRLREQMIPKLPPLFYLALHVIVTQSHCIR